MATITISDTDRRIDDAKEIEQFLAPLGVWYEHWPVAGRLQAEATAEDILAEYAPEIERLKQRGGFVTADVINVSPDTPNLDEMLAKFDKEHTHSEDEVRFTVEGRGVFWIHPEGAPVFSIEVEAGDLINVPAGTKHWFHLCDDRRIPLHSAVSGPGRLDAGLRRRCGTSRASPYLLGPVVYRRPIEG